MLKPALNEPPPKMDVFGTPCPPNANLKPWYSGVEVRAIIRIAALPPVVYAKAVRSSGFANEPCALQNPGAERDGTILLVPVNTLQQKFKKRDEMWLK